MDEKGLGKRLQAARQASGMTQQVLCQRADLSYSTLTKIERGAIKSPSIFTIQSIANALGISLDELIGRSSKTEIGPKQRQHSKTGVSFVYFDVNGCLVHTFHKALGQLTHDSGQPADLVEAAFWHYNDQACRGEISMADFNGILAKKLNMPSLDWFNYYLETVEPVPEVHELVNWVNEYYGVGLLSNIMPGLLEKLLDLGLLPKIKYDAIVDSSKVHVMKPEAQIYSLATDQAGQKPSEIMLIDDTRANLIAAEQSGWRVLWFDNLRPEQSAASIQEALEPSRNDYRVSPEVSRVDQMAEQSAW